MSLLTLLFAKPSSPAPPPAPPPAEPAVSAQPQPEPSAPPSLTALPFSGVVAPTAGTASQAPAATAGPASPTGTPVTATAVRAEFTRPDEDVERTRAIEFQRRWSLAEVLGAIGKAPGAEAILARADRPGPVEPGSLMEAVKSLRASLPSRD